MPDAVTIVNILGGIASRRRLLDAGCSGGDITRDVRLGGLRRIRRGHYASVEAPFEAVVAVRVGGVLAGPSAARSYGLWSGLDERIHVGLPRNASRLRLERLPHPHADRYPQEVVLHWVDGIDRADWRVARSVCLRQVVDWLSREDAIACLDTAITAWSEAEVRAAFSDSPPRARLIAAASRPGSGSGLESIVRQRLEARGHRVRQQVRFDRVGRVDMVVDDRLVLELDGRRFHWDADSFEEDRRRDARLTELDRPYLRLTFRQVIETWPSSVSVIQEVLGRL